MKKLLILLAMLSVFGVLVGIMYYLSVDALERDYAIKDEIRKKMDAITPSTTLPENIEVVLETNRGNIELKLFPKYAPLAVENFMTHIKEGYYDGTIFHRVIKHFMIQGGDPTGVGNGGESIWGVPFKDEFYKDLVFDKPGVLAMANAGFSTNGSQFFITTIEAIPLNGRHTIFGEVTKGMESVYAIEDAAVDSKTNKPFKEQKIIKAYIKE